MRRAALTSLLFAALLAMVAPAHAGGGSDTIQAELLANQAKWAQNGADDYSYTMQRSCFCTIEFVTPGIVKVRGGEIVEVSPVGAPGILDPALYLTVEGLFAVIQDAIDRGADQISVTWHPELGHPTDISIDFVFEVFDEEVGYTAREMMLGTGFEEDQAAQDAAMETWGDAGIAHYRYRFQRSCFCPPSFTAPGIVEVLNGVVVSVADPDTAEPLSPSNYGTIPDLFDVVQNAINIEAWQLSTEYDPVLGYPTEISIDPYEFIADDGTAYSASNLVDLPEPGALPLQLTALALLCARAGRRAHARSITGLRSGS